MELPAYHAPVLKNTFRATWERGWSFIKRAGTVIVAANIIIWFLNTLSFDGNIIGLIIATAVLVFMLYMLFRPEKKLKK
jgi:ferrous iron transport protein B